MEAQTIAVIFIAGACAVFLLGKYGRPNKAGAPGCSCDGGCPAARAGKCGGGKQ